MGTLLCNLICGPFSHYHILIGTIFLLRFSLLRVHVLDIMHYIMWTTQRTMQFFGHASTWESQLQHTHTPFCKYSLHHTEVLHTAHRSG